MRDPDRKRLWGRAGSRCAFCNAELTQVDGVDSIVGDEAHIRSGAANGPRYEASYPTEEVDSYDNRLLLCKAHHKLIDDNPEIFPTADLLTLKARHEERVSAALDTPPWVRVEPITTGGTLMAMVSDAMAYSFTYSEPLPADSSDLVGDFLQNAQDWGELGGDLGPKARMDAAVDLQRQISQLAELGFLVFAGWTTYRLQGLDMPTLVLRVTHIDEASDWFAQLGEPQP